MFSSGAWSVAGAGAGAGGQCLRRGPAHWPSSLLSATWFTCHRSHWLLLQWSQAGQAATARWSGRITSLVPVLLLSRSHAASRSVTLPPAPGRGRAVLGPAAAARQLQRDLRLDYAGGQNIPGRQFFVLWKINIRYQLIGRLRTWYFRIFLGSQK